MLLLYLGENDSAYSSVHQIHRTADRQDKYVIGPICLISSHTIKAPYKSLRQALIRWLCHLWYIV